MINPDSAATAARAAQRDDRLDALVGDAPKRCYLCGISDPVVLVISPILAGTARSGPADSRIGEPGLRRNRTRIENHHVANRVNEPDLTVLLCRNHHAMTTEDLASLGVPTRYVMGAVPSSLNLPSAGQDGFDCLSAILAGIGAFLIRAGTVLIEWAEWLTAVVASLTEHYPDWRTTIPHPPAASREGERDSR